MKRLLRRLLGITSLSDDLGDLAITVMAQHERLSRLEARVGQPSPFRIDLPAAPPRDAT